jgi:hypothetical protein
VTLPNPSELRISKQPIPTAKLIRWAEEAGFEVRSSNHGTSHLICRHKIENDIYFSIIRDSRKLSSQRNLSDALIELERRKVQNTFNAANSYEQSLLEKIPDHLSARLNHETGSLIVTNKQLPQIGITVRHDQMDLLENKLRFLDSVKRETFIAIHKARTGFDIDINVGKQDVFDGRIKHLIYTMDEISVPDYEEDGSPHTLRDAINLFVTEVSLKDMDHKGRLDAIAELPFIRDKTVIYHSRRGERTISIDYESPQRKQLHIEFQCFSNARNPGDVHDISSVRVSDTLLADLENQMTGIAKAHDRALTDRPIAQVA